MLITPVQPHNSLNNIITNRFKHSGVNQKENAKLPNIGLPHKKVQPSPRKNAKSQSHGSQSMAKKKLLLELKLQETMRKNAGQKFKNIEEHKEDLVQRKQMLSDILKEYEQISKDKNILTAEIRNMKTYLSDIRSKLDQSLSVLNKNATLIAMKHGLTNQLLGGPKLKSKRLKKRKKSLINNRQSGLQNSFLAPKV